MTHSHVIVLLLLGGMVVLHSTEGFVPMRYKFKIAGGFH